MATTDNKYLSFSPLYKGTHHMVGNDAFEPQRTNNFEIRFPTLGSLTSAGGFTYENCGTAITLSVSQVGDLNQSIDPIAVNYGNNAIKFAGKPTLNDIQLTINDFVGYETERILEAWSTKVYNKITQDIGKASAYKQRAYLIEYNTDYTISKAWQLEGCWPGSISYGGYAQDNAAVRQITVTLNVDFAIPLDKNTLGADFFYQK